MIYRKLAERRIAVMHNDLGEESSVYLSSNQTIILNDRLSEEQQKEELWLWFWDIKQRLNL